MLRKPYRPAVLAGEVMQALNDGMPLPPERPSARA
jgi:hypothetical protein